MPRRPLPAPPEIILKPWHLDVAADRDPAEPRKPRCTFGLHPAQDGSILAASCDCGGHAEDQCCNLTPCRRHKCTPRKCKCPGPEGEGAAKAAA